MYSNADKMSCKLLLYPKGEKYTEHIRQFQGCPTIAITKKGRIFLGWYAGGTREPHMDNYNILIYSDDNGKTWTDPVLVIPSSKEKFIHSLDIQLWISPEGKLHVFWIQNNIDLETSSKPELKENQPWICVDGYQFPDFKHSQWLSICDDPDAEKLSFSEPQYLFHGFMRNKPLVLKNGRRLLFNYDQEDDRYGYSISDDQGKTYKHCYGSKKISTEFDEAMGYEMENGCIRMLARAKGGYLAQSFSDDDGVTWKDTTVSEIASPYTRFYISRTPSGRVILVNNDDTGTRKNMTVYLSEDDGFTWKYKRCIDERNEVSYPDVDFYGGRIYLVYDRERIGAREILFTSFTEEEIMDDDYRFDIQIVSKPDEIPIGKVWQV